MGRTHGSYVPLGYIKGAHGLDGSVKVVLYNPDSTAIAAGATVFLLNHRDRQALNLAQLAGLTAQDLTTCQVLRVKHSPGAALVKLDCCADRIAAQELSGCKVLMSRRQLPALNEDERYLFDLIGIDVVDLTGAIIGVLAGVTQNGSQDLLVIHRDNREALVPDVAELVRAVDEERGILVLDPPPGLLDDPDLWQPLS